MGPVEGTVATHEHAFNFEKTPEDELKAASLKNPPADDFDLERAKQKYDQYCLICHGENGDGQGHLFTSGKYPIPPSNCHVERAMNKTDGQLFHNIRAGFGVMGAHGPQLSVEDFSSNAIRTLAYGFAQFIHNGGVLRIITNHFLSIKDKLLISDDEIESLVEDKDVEYIVNKDLEGLAKILEKGDQHFFDCLKYLLKKNRLQIIPVKLKPNRLAHFKQGILDDGTNQVYFNGSCNFTYRGLIDNGESLSIARSWGENSEKIKVKENIERICNKEDAGFEYLTPEQIITVIEKTGNDKRLDELIEDEINIYEKISHLPSLKNTFAKYTSDFKKKVEEEKHNPKFPYPEGPRSYQAEAYQNWVSNNQKGIFAMATGTEKTFAA